MIVIFLLVIIPAFIVFVVSKTNLQIYFKILIIIGSIILEDMICKLSGGHPNDFEEAGLINLLLIIATVLATTISFVLLINKAKQNAIYTSCLIMLIPISFGLYMLYFNSLGLIDSENASPSKEISIKNHVFLKDLQFSDNSVVYKPDSIKIISGWSEKEVIVDHQHLLKRFDDTSKVNYILNLKSNRSFRNNNIYYKVNDTDENGSNPVDSIISFDCQKSAHSVIISFFKLRENAARDTLIQKVTIH